MLTVLKNARIIDCTGNSRLPKGDLSFADGRMVENLLKASLSGDVENRCGRKNGSLPGSH